MIAVANSKGGCGKTTVATHLAARFARFGFQTALIDLDRQGAAYAWCQRRPKTLPLIRASQAEIDEIEVPRDASYVILDVPAGPRRKGLEAVVKAADLLVVPVGPSAFDQDGTRHFLEIAAEHKPVRKGRRPIAIVPNRVRAKAAGQAQFDAFLAQLGHPIVTSIADSPFYLSAAETGITVFDQPEWRVRPRLAEWAPLLQFIHELIAADAS